MPLVYELAKTLRRKASETALLSLGLSSEEFQRFCREHDDKHPEMQQRICFYHPVLSAWLKANGHEEMEEKFWPTYKEVSYSNLQFNAYHDVAIPWNPKEEEEIFGQVEAFGIQGGTRTLTLRDREEKRRILYLNHTVLQQQVQSKGVRQGHMVLIRFLGMVYPKPVAFSSRPRRPYYGYVVEVLE